MQYKYNCQYEYPLTKWVPVYRYICTGIVRSGPGLTPAVSLSIAGRDGDNARDTCLVHCGCGDAGITHGGYGGQGDAQGKGSRWESGASGDGVVSGDKSRGRPLPRERRCVSGGE